MMRVPSASGGVPGCWGRFRGDEACDVCPRSARCEMASNALRQRETVREYARRVGTPEAIRARVDEVEPEQLALYAQKCYVRAGGTRPWTPWGVTRSYVSAMAAVCAACYASGWSPKRYVEAQIQMLSLSIAAGWSLKAGHFTSKKARDRFACWVARKEAAFGNAQSDTRSDEKELAASLVYVEHRFDGHAVEDALAAAQGMLPEWSTRCLSVPRIKAMCAERIVERLSPGLADCVLIPAGKWRISDILSLCSLLRGDALSDPSPRVTTSGSILGDFL